MRIDKYIPVSQDVVIVSQAEEVRAAFALLEAAKARIDELRTETEDRPRECPDDLTKDWRYLAGQIAGLKWILGLPGRSRDFIKKL